MTKATVRAMASSATTTVKAANYTPEQEAVMMATARGRESGKLTIEDAVMFAADFGKTVKSIVAKLSRMGIYSKKEYTTKNGEKAVRKDAHAEAIGAILRLTEAEVDSLTKANKTALVAIFAALANSKPLA